MIKKTLIALVVVFVALIAAVVIVGHHKTTVVTPTTTTRHVTQKTIPPWSGAESRTVDTTFTRGDTAVVEVDQESFTGLDTPHADLQITLTVQPTSTGGVPKWLTEKTFEMADTETVQQVFPLTNMKVAPVNDSYEVLLTYNHLPTADLAAGYSTSADALGLTITSPTGPFRIVILPPSPPLGHKFGIDNNPTTTTTTSTTSTTPATTSAPHKTKRTHGHKPSSGKSKDRAQRPHHKSTEKRSARKPKKTASSAQSSAAKAAEAAARKSAKR